MVGVLSLPRTTIGKKVIMAVTGLIWIGFVVFHMYGNLKIFGGADYFNTYSEGLREIGEPVFGATHLLWIARLVLVAAIALHIWAAVTLKQRNWSSRSVKYSRLRYLQADYATLTMFWGGVALFFFILFHLMHFTWGIPGVHPDFIAGDAYHNVIVGFRSYAYIPSILYLLGLIALALHLYHGAWSMFQTVGLNNKTYTNMLQALALLIAVVIPVGFALVPLAVMFGLVS
jgi:succinate dehydrogenase / fumarate reductase cytochrome b subunit